MPVKSWITVIGAYLVFVGALAFVRLAGSLALKSQITPLGAGIGLGFGVLDLIAGVGLLRGLKWSWYVAVAVQSAAILYVLLGTILPLVQALPQVHAAPFFSLGKLIIIVGELIIPCAIPAWCIYYLLRPDARSLLLRGGEARATR